MLTTRRPNLRRTGAAAALGLALLGGGITLAAEPEGPAALPPPPTLPADGDAAPTRPQDPPAVPSAAAAPAAPAAPTAPTAPAQAEPAASPAAPAPPPAATGTPASAAGSSTPQLRDLDRRIGELKDQVFRAKARLSLLNDTTVRSTAGSARAVIVHQHKLGPLYRAVRLAYQIDGRDIFGRSDETGALARDLGKDLTVWEGGLKPGDHILGITVVFRGNGAKVFSYYDQYTFTTRAAHRFTAVDGQTARLQVVCFEKGNALTTAVEQRPTCELRTGEADRDKGAPKAAAEKPAPAAAGTANVGANVAGAK